MTYEQCVCECVCDLFFSVNENFGESLNLDYRSTSRLSGLTTSVMGRVGEG